MDTQPLANIRVLVTRPEHQARYLIGEIKRLGGLAFHLPTIKIVYQSRKPALPDADLIIFTSVNAVTGAQLSRASYGNRKAPLIAAIGTATLSALQDCGFQDIISPQSNGNSESLLALLAPQVLPSMKIIIFRGDSGRDVLRNGLLTLGAQVTYEEVYKRTLPDHSSMAATPGELWQQAGPNIVSLSSDLGLYNLIALLPDKFHRQLFTKPLVVNSERCLKKAIAEGFSADIFVASPPGDRGQIHQLHRYAQSNY